ncbi:MAG: cytochrome c [Oligoflexia bacterium]|nr:cytochrome c [Oligoflexia bacterium]
MKFRLLMVFVLLLFASLGLAQDMTFKSHGRVVKTLGASELEKISPAQTILVWDPTSEKEISYRAHSVEAVFQSVFGNAWKNSEEILFTCIDGYRPSIPTSRFIQHKAFIAVARTDNKNFDLMKINKKIELGPYYLIWENSKYPELKVGDGPSWPYQLAAVDLTTFNETFPKIAPPKNSSPAVKRGFLAFRKNCLPCHSINGNGGKEAPELNYPVNITQYYKETWLKKWISDPKSIRFRTPMPPFPEVSGRDKIINDIISYLKAIRANKHKPD